MCTSTMSPGPTATPCAAAAPSSSSGPIGKPGSRCSTPSVARDVEQHRAADDAARELVHAEPARAAGRGDEPGPIAVVERRVAADVAEAVELGRRLERHHDVVVGHRERGAAAPAAEHAVARGHAVEVQRLGAVAARRRRPIGQREREALAGLHAARPRPRRARASGGSRCRSGRGRRSGPSCDARRARADDLAVGVDAVLAAGPSRGTDRRGCHACGDTMRRWRTGGSGRTGTVDDGECQNRRGRAT